MSNTNPSNALPLSGEKLVKMRKDARKALAIGNMFYDPALIGEAWPDTFIAFCDLHEAFTTQAETIEAQKKEIAELAGAREAAKWGLLCAMEAYSESVWASGWYSGLEFILWNKVEDSDEPELKRIALLKKAANGWWTWGRDSLEQEFVSLEEFALMYDARYGE